MQPLRTTAYAFRPSAGSLSFGFQAPGGQAVPPAGDAPPPAAPANTAPEPVQDAPSLPPAASDPPVSPDMPLTRKSFYNDTFIANRQKPGETAQPARSGFLSATSAPQSVSLAGAPAPANADKDDEKNDKNTSRIVLGVRLAAGTVIPAAIARCFSGASMKTAFSVALISALALNVMGQWISKGDNAFSRKLINLSNRILHPHQAQNGQVSDPKSDLVAAWCGVSALVNMGEAGINILMGLGNKSLHSGESFLTRLQNNAQTASGWTRPLYRAVSKVASWGATAAQGVGLNRFVQKGWVKSALAVSKSQWFKRPVYLVGSGVIGLISGYIWAQSSLKLEDYINHKTNLRKGKIYDKMKQADPNTPALSYR